MWCTTNLNGRGTCHFSICVSSSPTITPLHNCKWGLHLANNSEHFLVMPELLSWGSHNLTTLQLQEKLQPKRIWFRFRWKWYSVRTAVTRSLSSMSLKIPPDILSQEEVITRTASKRNLFKVRVLTTVWIPLGEIFPPFLSWQTWTSQSIFFPMGAKTSIKAWQTF